MSEPAPVTDYPRDEQGRGYLLRVWQEKYGVQPPSPPRKLAPLSFYGGDGDEPAPPTLRPRAPAPARDDSAHWREVLAALMEQAVRNVINDEVNAALDPFRKAFAELKQKGHAAREDLRQLEEAFARLELFVEDLSRQRQPAATGRPARVR